MFPFPFVFLGKNPFEPVCLPLCSFLITECRVLKDNELLAATVTPKRAHFLESWCSLSHLTLLDRNCFHPLIFYLALCIAFPLLGPPARATNSPVQQPRLSQAEQIVHRMPKILLAPEVAFRGLN